MMAMATCIAISVTTGPVGLFGKSMTSGTSSKMVTANAARSRIRRGVEVTLTTTASLVGTGVSARRAARRVWCGEKRARDGDLELLEE
jgi:hypothetical protein